MMTEVATFQNSKNRIGFWNITGTDDDWSVAYYNDDIGRWLLVTAPDTMHNTIVNLVIILDELVELANKFDLKDKEENND
jgi:hypothetical protein